LTALNTADRVTAVRRDVGDIKILLHNYHFKQIASENKGPLADLFYTVFQKTKPLDVL